MTLNRAEYGSQQSIQLIGCQNLSSRFAVKICCQDLLSRLVVNIINIVNIVNIFNMVNLTNIMISIPAQGLLNLCQIFFKSLSNIFRCAIISWIYVGDSVSDLVINVFEI